MMSELLGSDEPMAAGIFDRSGKLLRRAESTTEIVCEQGDAGPRWLRVLHIPQVNGEELRVVADVTENVRAAALRGLLESMVLGGECLHVSAEAEVAGCLFAHGRSVHDIRSAIGADIPRSLPYLWQLAMRR